MQEDFQGCLTSPEMPQPPSPCCCSLSPRPLSPPPIPPPSPPPPDFDNEAGDNFAQDPSPGDDYPPSTILKVRTAIKFIHLVKQATLASQFESEELEELRNPQAHESTPLEDSSLKLSLLNFNLFLGHSQKAYEGARQNIQLCFPEIELLSYYQVERRAQRFTGIITWEHHMCVKSCIGFTGPYSQLEQCPNCGEPRYTQESDSEWKVP